METTEPKQKEIFPTLSPSPDQKSFKGSGGKLYKRTCGNCGNEFETKMANEARTRFCSDLCRGQAFRKNKREKHSLPPQAQSPAGERTQVVATLGSLPAHAQYIITSQEREIARWEKNYDEEKTRRKKAEEQMQDLKDKIKDIEHKQALNGIENATPPVWERVLGALPPTVVEKVLGAFTDKFIAPQITGVDGQLDSEAQTQVAQITQWYATMPKTLQQQVYAILTAFAASPSQDQLTQTLIQISNLLQHGTTAVNPAPLFGTFD